MRFWKRRGKWVVEGKMGVVVAVGLGLVLIGVAVGELIKEFLPKLAFLW